jgi:hypothetical protein
MKKTQEIALEEKYLHAAIELGIARNAYNHKKGNEVFSRLMRTAKEIRLTVADGGQNFFTSLLAHEMPHVVKAAAFNLIPLNPALARKAYKELAKSPSGEVRLDAEVTLKEWKAGTLDPEWFMKQ